MKKILNEVFIFTVSWIAVLACWVVFIIFGIIWLLSLVFTLPFAGPSLKFKRRQQEKPVHIDPADLVPLDMYSKLSPEDTIKWAELEHESREHLMKHRREIDEAEERAFRKRWGIKDEEDEKPKKKKILLLGESGKGHSYHITKANKAFRPPALPEADGEGSPPEHSDSGSDIRPM